MMVIIVVVALVFVECSSIVDNLFVVGVVAVFYQCVVGFFWLGLLGLMDHSG